MRWIWGRRGHGTYVENEKVIASVAGTMERVNKLVSVRPLRSKCVSFSLALRSW